MIKRIAAVTLALMLTQSLFVGFPKVSSATPGTQSAQLEGTVLDPQGAGVMAARVLLQTVDGRTVAEAQTGDGGRFVFTSIPAGTYEIVVEASGFKQTTKPIITIKAGGREAVSLRLEVAPITEKVDVSAIHPSYTALRAAKLSGDYATVTNLVLKRDLATITFKQGQLFFLTPTEGKVTAAVFIGDGEIQATPLIDVEAKHLSNFTGAVSFIDQFSKMALRFTDDTYEAVKKAAEIKTGPVNAQAQDYFNDHRYLLKKGKTGIYSLAGAFLRYNLDGRLLMDLLSTNQSGLFYAFFDAKKYGDSLFGIDPLGNPFVKPEEVVLVNFNEKSDGVWISEHLREHYASAAVFDETHQLIDFLHYNIDATMKGKRLEANVQTKFKALADGLRVLPFDLFAKLRVSKVTDDQGRALRFIQEDKEQDADFYVVLAEPLKKDQEFSLTFEYAGDDAVMDSGGGNFTLVTRSNWYPNTAGFGEDRATFEMTLRTAKDLTMVATGQPVSEAVEDEKMVTRWKTEVPLAVAGFNYGRFKKDSLIEEKTKYTIETYANKDIPDYLKEFQRRVEQAQSQGIAIPLTIGSLNTTSMMGKARAEAQLSIELFTDMFGQLPYGRLAMTQQPYPSFGQAWPMLVYMPLTAFLDGTIRHQLGMDRANNFFKIVGPHEVAHQWWGHVIGWKSYRDQWMSEGFADFSASLFAQVVYKNEKFIELWREHRERIVAKNQYGKRPIDVGSVYMGYRLSSPKFAGVAQAILYPKGAFILHMIRMMMWDRQTGDQNFLAMMKDFVKTHYNQNVSTQDFQRIVEKHMTADMDLDGRKSMAWFFNEWVYGTSMPDYKLDYTLEAADGGKTKLKLKITQSNVDEAFKMRVPIYLDFDGKIMRLGSVAIAGNSTTKDLEIILPQKPKRVLLCAYEDVLCTTNTR